ncbi:Uncharacterised protein [Mycobacteroides abscessus subsp. abscessus]|nr:Uncharacterised protein [Mycobacteroides abscessus subsp. abscessus]
MRTRPTDTTLRRSAAVLGYRLAKNGDTFHVIDTYTNTVIAEDLTLEAVTRFLSKGDL